MDQTVSKDVFEGKWKQMRGQVREWWGKLTDEDLDRVAGKSEKLVGLLQEKYGYTRERAEADVTRRIADFEAQQKKSTVPTP